MYIWKKLILLVVLFTSVLFVDGANAAAGKCGTANGQKLSTKPTSTISLCSVGKVKDVAMTETTTTWGWTCLGTDGGSSVNCYAYKDSSSKKNGVCGPYHSQTIENTNGALTSFCTIGDKGVTTTSTSNRKYTWTCYGMMGGSNVDCYANMKINGVCGKDNGGSFESAPKPYGDSIGNLCSAGSLGTNVTGTGPWSWTCSGYNGGYSVSCSAKKVTGTKVDGVCNVYVNGQTLSNTPTNLCSTGTSSNFYGNGPWTWNCNGSNGGITASCKAYKLTTTRIGDGRNSTQTGTTIIQPITPKIDGVCGADNGKSLSTTPTNLCSVGSNSSVSGIGPWTWTCNGINGGKSASCYASKIKVIDGVCGSDNGKNLSSVPNKAYLCNSGISSGEPKKDGNAWYWGCLSTNGGKNADCKANEMINGTCGGDNGKTLSTTPTNLCSVGNTSSVSGIGPWTWTCNGSNGGKTASCYASKIKVIDGVCGTEYGKNLSVLPTKNYLCKSGMSSGEPKKDGNAWYRSCLSTNGGKNADCKANEMINGTCGGDNGKSLSTTPTNLCSVGNASSVNGSGPWTWTCNGSNSGRTALCSASKLAVKEDGVCGSSNGQKLEKIPNSNFCNVGKTSGVVTDTKAQTWSWTCYGINGGANIKCGAYMNIKIDGKCGYSASLTHNEIPKTNLCSTGNSDIVAVSNVGGSLSGSLNTLTWNCLGTNGGTNANCTAYMTVKINGTCGTYNGQTLSEIPTTNNGSGATLFCSNGKVNSLSVGTVGSSVNSNSGNLAPINWYCSGINGGTSVKCMAYFKPTSETRAGINRGNSCSTTLPANATTKAGTPTSSNQAWQATNSYAPCFYTCNINYKLVSGNCVGGTIANSCAEYPKCHNKGLCPLTPGNPKTPNQAWQATNKYDSCYVSCNSNYQFLGGDCVPK